MFFDLCQHLIIAYLLGVVDLPWGQHVGSIVIAGVYIVTSMFTPAVWSNPLPINIPGPLSGYIHIYIHIYIHT